MTDFEKRDIIPYCSFDESDYNEVQNEKLILLIEDDISMLTILKKALEDAG